MRLVLCLFERSPHSAPEVAARLAGKFLPRSQCFPQVAVLDFRQYPCHGRAALVAPRTSLFLHPATVQPMVALACAEAPAANKYPGLGLDALRQEFNAALEPYEGRCSE